MKNWLVSLFTKWRCRSRRITVTEAHLDAAIAGTEWTSRTCIIAQALPNKETLCTLYDRAFYKGDARARYTLSGHLALMFAFDNLACLWGDPKMIARVRAMLPVTIEIKPLSV